MTHNIAPHINRISGTIISIYLIVVLGLIIYPSQIYSSVSDVTIENTPSPEETPVLSSEPTEQPTVTPTPEINSTTPSPTKQEPEPTQEPDMTTPSPTQNPETTPSPTLTEQPKQISPTKEPSPTTTPSPTYTVTPTPTDKQLVPETITAGSPPPTPLETGYTQPRFPGDTNPTEGIDMVCYRETYRDTISFYWGDSLTGDPVKDPTLIYQVQYKHDGAGNFSNWEDIGYYTGTYTDYFTFPFVDRNDIRYGFTVRAIYDENGNGMYDTGEPASDWSYDTEYCYIDYEKNAGPKSNIEISQMILTGSGTMYEYTYDAFDDDRYYTNELTRVQLSYIDDWRKTQYPQSSYDWVRYQVLLNHTGNCPAQGTAGYTRVAVDSDVVSSVRTKVKDGNNVVCFYAEDAFGVTETSIKKKTIRYDATPPQHVAVADFYKSTYDNGVYYVPYGRPYVKYYVKDPASGVVGWDIRIYSANDNFSCSSTVVYARDWDKSVYSYRAVRNGYYEAYLPDNLQGRYCMSVTAYDQLGQSLTTSTYIKFYVGRQNYTITYPDVPEEYTFYKDIMELSAEGIINGYEDGFFRPDEKITRGQMAKFVRKANGFALAPCPDVTWPPQFSDVPTNHPFYHDIETLRCNRVVNGYADGTFRPDQYVSRAEATKYIINGTIKKANLNRDVNIFWSIVPVQFPDVPRDHTFFRYIFLASYSDKAISGYPDGTFRPDEPMTRGAMSKVVNKERKKFFKYLGLDSQYENLD